MIFWDGLQSYTKTRKVKEFTDSVFRFTLNIRSMRTNTLFLLRTVLQQTILIFPECNWNQMRPEVFQKTGNCSKKTGISSSSCFQCLCDGQRRLLTSLWKVKLPSDALPAVSHSTQTRETRETTTLAVKGVISHTFILGMRGMKFTNRRVLPEFKLENEGNRDGQEKQILPSPTSKLQM